VILTDREIKISLERKLIVIDPPPADGAFSSTSVDLTLDAALRRFREGAGGVRREIDPSDPTYSFQEAVAELTDAVQIDARDGFKLHPRALVLGWTAERINLKSESRVAAWIEGKSSLARLGLAVHVTAPTIHAGFRGSIQLEIVNHGPWPIVLRPGMRVCQLVIKQTLGVPDRGYGGQFADQAAS
jgi:dCTP deaminase